MIALVLAIAAVAGLAFASVSRKWLYNARTEGGDEIGFGPRGMFECSPADGEDRTCKSMSNAALVAKWKDLVATTAQIAKDNPQDLEASQLAQQTAEMLHTAGGFSTFGWIAFVACLIAALSLLVAALLVAANKRIAWPIMPTTTALLGLLVALITGCVFVALKPGPPGMVGVNLGFFLFGGGVVLGIAASLMLNKLLRPLDEDLLADSMTAEDY